MKSESIKTVLILGLPNSGKTQVFNNLTGKYEIVSNYPMTTIETTEGICRIKGEKYRIIDSPGFHGLYIHSEEEILIRDAIYTIKPDIIIQCIDANRFKQSLSLTAELIELQIPTIISLNAIDETTKKGITIHSDRLAQLLGIPVVESIATADDSVQLKKALATAAIPHQSLQYPAKLSEHIDKLAKKLPETIPFAKKTASLLLQSDPSMIEFLKQHYPEANLDLLTGSNKINAELKGDINQIIRNGVGHWIEEVSSKTVENDKKRKKASFLEKAAAYSRNPLTGFPILLFFVLISYFSVVHIAGWLEGLLANFIFDPATNYIAGLLPSGFWTNFIIGDYGILSLGIFNAFGTVLPILTVFFLIFGFMEDIGYLPNLTVLVKRSFEKVGLSGKSIMPIILGFGCKTMATLTTKSISSRKEKLIAIYLIGFAIPCSAQMGLNMAILGKNGFKAFVTAILFLVLVEVLAGLILNKIIKDDKKTLFIQELPPFRVPSPRAIFKKTWFRMVSFLKESLLVFVIAAAALFFLDLSGILNLLKVVLAPVVVDWLGLPIDMVDALILTMARHEAAAGLILRMSDQGMLNVVQSIIAVVITTMFVPCFANVVAMLKEAGKKAGIIMVLAINISSFVLAGLFFRFLLLIF